MFKRYLEDQRKAALSSVEQVSKGVQIAHALNEPILCTTQMYDEVFNKYHQKAVQQEKAKYEELIAKRD